MLQIKGKVNTATITDKAVPNVVGVDIGCGMYTVKLGIEVLRPFFNYKAS